MRVKQLNYPMNLHYSQTSNLKFQTRVNMPLQHGQFIGCRTLTLFHTYVYNTIVFINNYCFFHLLINTAILCV